MATTQEYALLSLYVYQVGRAALNRPNLPNSGWTLLEIKEDNLLGFSYGVFKRSGTNEIVLAYTGTNGGIDWVSNITAGLGLPSWQVSNAALVYQQVKEKYGDNITLSGHSLGGGLASVMATWFNRPAVVFDEAPFQTTAANPVMLALVRVQLFLAGYTDAAMDNAIIDFSSREGQVANHYLQGEILSALRFDANTVAGSDTRIDINGSQASAVQLHSQALLAATRMSEPFRLATYASKSVVPLILDETLYGFNTANSIEKNFLLDLIRSEQNSVVGQGKLTHFAADLNKLGTNIQGLNKAAQDALIAQGIEWYYWQGTDYAGQEFFTQTGESLQYTTAMGAGLANAQTKAASYVGKWLTPIVNDHGEFYSASFSTYDQWNVATGGSGASLTALASSKSQIFIGGAGGDTFTGGDLGDVLVGDVGNDAIAGGASDDILLGGSGDDNIWGDLETSLINQDWAITRSVTTQGNTTIYTLNYSGVFANAQSGGGDDAIFAGAGVVWVMAEDGDDYIDGGAGDDVLFGERGRDDLFGGTGTSRFKSNAREQRSCRTRKKVLRGHVPGHASSLPRASGNEALQ